jgi:hypothetical protein
VRTTSIGQKIETRQATGAETEAAEWVKQGIT